MLAASSSYREVPILIDAKQLKLQVRNSGHKLSSNAFTTLSLLLKQLCLSLADAVASAADVSACEDDLGQALPWAGVMEGVKRCVPALESWFGKAYERLVEHVDAEHADELPSREVPCCFALLESELLIQPVQVTGLLRAALGRHGLSLNWYGMNAICLGMDEIVQWTLRVSLRMMDAQGVGTLRQADLVQIIQRAPVFSGFYFEPPVPAYDDAAATEVTREDVEERMNSFREYTPSTIGLEDARERMSSLRCHEYPPTSPSSYPPTSDISVAELSRMVQKTLSSPPPMPPPPSFALKEELRQEEPKQEETKQEEPKIEAIRIEELKQDSAIEKTRYVICSDRQFPWMHISSQATEQAVFLQSTGVETDLADSSILLEENRRLKAELEETKALVLRLLSQKQ